MQTKVLYGFLFADDMTKGAPTDDAKMFDSYNFTISIKKTEMVYKPAPGKPNKEPTTTMKGQL